MRPQNIQEILQEKANKLEVAPSIGLWQKVEKQLPPAPPTATIKPIWKLSIAASLLIAGSALAILIYNMGYERGARDVVWEELKVGDRLPNQEFYRQVHQYHRSVAADKTLSSWTPTHSLAQAKQRSALESKPASPASGIVAMESDQLQDQASSSSPINKRTSTYPTDIKRVPMADTSQVTLPYGKYQESREDQFMKNDRQPWLLESTPQVGLRIIHGGYVEDFRLIQSHSTSWTLQSNIDEAKMIIISKMETGIKLIYRIDGDLGNSYTLLAM